ncbi:phage holin family protein [Streptomyces massasporeus]|uniref:phage holin family protein n=1 Tax=Streptomyces massasporeus TaxID=67324 RepID=UPI00340ED26C
MTDTHRTAPAAPRSGSAPTGGDEPVGELVQRATEQLTDLVRGEMRLAQAEMTEKGKRFGKGGGLFGGAGVLGFVTLQALVATVIAALAVALPVWAAALIVTGVLAVATGLTALAGRKQVRSATPPAPQRTIDSVKADMAEIKESAQR